MLDGSAKPREHDKHILACCPPEDEQTVFKWPTQTGVRWTNQLRNEVGTHPTKETHNRMISNTSVLHAAAGAETARALNSILRRELQTDPNTQGGQLKIPLDSWNKFAHHRGYEGSFVEFLEPGEEPILIEVSSYQEDPDSRGSMLRGWEYTPSKSSKARRGPGLGATDKLWDNPRIAYIEITHNCQRHVHLAAVTREALGGTDIRTILVGGGGGGEVELDGDE